ncbi:MAG: MFS transporter [Candidatus Micrarchaeota archaeon]|nr:MFS transporter [Candidatus Micrarchaeota archaeon]
MQPTDGADRKSIRESMGNSIKEGAGYAIMTGAGDTYLPAAILHLGASNFQIGVLAALPHIVGGISQFFSLDVLRLIKSRKVLVTLSAAIQALCWIPIILTLVLPIEKNVELIILSYTIGAMFVWIANPAWSSWITDIVPENERADFFAKRNKIMQLLLFLTTFAVGVLLNELQRAVPVAIAFGLIFIIPFVSRLATIVYHWKTADIKYEIQLVKEIKLKHLFLLPSYKKELWFLIFIAMINFSVQFASPFFTPYMISGLGFSLEIVGIMIAASILAKVISYEYWGKAIDRFGNRLVLIATSFGMVLIPFSWLISTDKLWLLFSQIYSGFIWAGLDLASFNFALSIVGRELRPSFISKYNAFGSLFYASGAIAGGIFLQIKDITLAGLSGIPLVFLISGIMRLSAILIFASRITTSKEIVNKSEERGMIIKLVAVYPTQGAIQQVLDGWNFTRKIVRKKAIEGKNYFAYAIKSTKEIIKRGEKITAKFKR